jgi:quercetin dioxygenase-like cupin family protein
MYDIDNLVVELVGDFMSTVIRAADSRVNETPSVKVTTFASPTLGPSAGLSLWRAEMVADAQGPLHVFDSEQVWTVVDGTLSIALGDETVELTAGDTIVMPAGAERQVTATSAAQMIVCGHGDAIASVPGEDAPRGTPRWIA